MVRRLIEQQNVGALERQDAENDASLKTVAHRPHGVHLPRPGNAVLSEHAAPLLKFRHTLLVRAGQQNAFREALLHVLNRREVELQLGLGVLVVVPVPGQR